MSEMNRFFRIYIIEDKYRKCHRIVSSDFTRKVNFMGDYLKLIRDTLLLLLVGVLILYSLFMTVCCVWFGMNPITFIQVFHFGKDISVMPDNISSSSLVVLEIGDTWEEGTLFRPRGSLSIFAE